MTHPDLHRWGASGAAAGLLSAFYLDRIGADVFGWALVSAAIIAWLVTAEAYATRGDREPDIGPADPDDVQAMTIANGSADEA